MTPDPAARDLLPLLEAQNSTISFGSFGYDDAFALGSALMARATAEGLVVTVSIVFGEQRVFHAARPGTSADNDDWLARKFRVVNRFNAPSYLIGTRARATGSNFHESTGLSPALYMAHGGAFPLRVNGSLIGVAGVSGLPQRDDHDLVVWALEAAMAAA
ncbi:heme-degrading domain-containing protein [Cryobacterium sp.]|uniref:heme-degrading domain-containing protein n=1 Tax=Cryobacterium sp. TaxID=1926290 RepID=UPI0026334A64|nr:heme-degrading domain-containing protein [Cryobacterium sp.]